MRIGRVILYVASALGLFLYLMFVVLPFRYGQCSGWIHWCLNTSGPSDLLVGQPIEMLLPMTTLAVIFILRRRRASRKTLLFDMAIGISLGSLILAGLTGWYFFSSRAASGLSVSNGGTSGQGTIDYANGIVDNAMRALLSGALLGVLVSFATPFLCRQTKRLFLWSENNLMRHPPPSTTISDSHTDARSPKQEFALLFRRSVFFAANLGLIYSTLGFEAIFPAQGSKGMPVLEPGFLAVFFFSTAIPAMVGYLERNKLVIKREGHADEPFSESVMKWFSVATSLTGILALIVSLRSLGQFAETPISFLFAFITFMAAPFAIAGSCLSIVAFPAGFFRKEGKIASLLCIIAVLVILAYPFVVMYPRDLLNWLFAQNVADQIRYRVSNISDFAYGSSWPFGFYYYPITLLVGVLCIIAFVKKGRLKYMREIVKVGIAVSLGIALALGPRFLFKHNEPWPLWTFVVQPTIIVVLALSVPVVARVQTKKGRLGEKSAYHTLSSRGHR